MLSALQAGVDRIDIGCTYDGENYGATYDEQWAAKMAIGRAVAAA
jgi:hypothetical protein